jgi:hypothetical protein
MIYCENIGVQTETSSDSDFSQTEKKPNWKGLGLWGLLSFLALILELIRRFFLGFDFGSDSSSSLIGSDSLSNSSRSASPEPASGFSISPYASLAFSICQYLAPRNGETSVVTDMLFMKQLNLEHGFNIFDLETQAKIGAEIYKVLRNFGFSEQGAKYKATLYLAACQAWDSVTNSVEYQGTSLSEFVDVVREIALEASLT